MTGRRRALIVANDRYDNEGLRRLVSPAADADALGSVLGDPSVGDFDVRVVHNEDAHVIGSRIEDLFVDSRPDDVLLLHFSCHGLKSESGELFLAARNTRPDRLGSTAVSADFVQRCMRMSRSRSIVLLLDCCYGGAFSQGVTVRAAGDVNVLDSFPGGRLGGGRGRAVITASSSMEYAFEGDRLADQHGGRPSVFTAALVQGLTTGDADRDEDGWVSLNELYDYVFDRVRERNPNQTPSRDVEMQGELYLARSGRRRLRAQPVPADLRAAMTDPNMFSRLGAVTELRTRLLSDNLPVAAGAGEALREIADTDIQYVAEAAATALAEARARPAESRLAFGPVPLGADAGVRVVHLLGPPLARACAYRGSDNWIRVTGTPDGLAVSVDTGRTGARRGSVLLTGPAGEVQIPVEVDVTEPAPTRPAPPAAEPPAATTTVADPTPATTEPVTTEPVTTEPATREPVATGPAAGPRPQRQAASSPVRPGPAELTARVLTLAGAASVVLGVVELSAPDDEYKLITILLQVFGYAAAWTFLAVAPGEGPPSRRIARAVLAASVVLAAGWLVAAPPDSDSLAGWAIQTGPLYLFWLVAGVMEIGAALLGGRSTRPLELLAGTAGITLGVVVIWAVAAGHDPLLRNSFGWYFVAYGLIWVTAGMRRQVDR